MVQVTQVILIHTIQVIQLIHMVQADMIFVKNFTQPDFQAKSFTPQQCIICDIFLQIDSVNASNINNLVIFRL